MIQFPLQCSNPPEIGLDPIFWSKPVFKEWWQQGIVDSPAFSYSECTVGACFPRGTRCLFLPIRCRDFTVTDTFCKDFCSFLTLNIVCPNLRSIFSLLVKLHKSPTSTKAGGHERGLVGSEGRSWDIFNG